MLYFHLLSDHNVFPYVDFPIVLVAFRKKSQENKILTHARHFCHAALTWYHCMLLQHLSNILWRKDTQILCQGRASREIMACISEDGYRFWVIQYKCYFRNNLATDVRISEHPPFQVKLSIAAVLRKTLGERQQYRTGRPEAFCGKSKHSQIAHGHTESSWKSTRKLQSHPLFQREEKKPNPHLFFVP